MIFDINHHVLAITSQYILTCMHVFMFSVYKLALFSSLTWVMMWHSSSGFAMLQWICWAQWDRGRDLQAVWSVVQHTETKASSPTGFSLNLYALLFLINWSFSTTRGEFENDANPDLNKDVYLQDIHCVSSLCKAYFRELPNPLLTYQLYDKFAVSEAHTHKRYVQILITLTGIKTKSDKL